MKGAINVLGVIIILLLVYVFVILPALSRKGQKQTGSKRNPPYSTNRRPTDADTLKRYMATRTGNHTGFSTFPSYGATGVSHSNLFEGDIPVIDESIKKMKANSSDHESIIKLAQRAESYVDAWLHPKPVEEKQEQGHIQYSLSMSYDEIQQYIDQVRFQSCFSEMVLSIMEKKGLAPKEFCSRALFDRKLFHSLKTGGSNYQPSKDTAVRCCLALRLTSAQTSELLQIAGYSLSRRQKRDLLTRYCIENCIWNLFDVDELYIMMGEKPLIG